MMSQRSLPTTRRLNSRRYVLPLALGLGLILSAGQHSVQADPPGGTTGWVTTFNDQFSGTALNTSAWIPYVVYNQNGQMNETPNYAPYPNPIAYYVGDSSFGLSGNISVSGGYADLASVHYPNGVIPYYGSYGTQYYTSSWMVSDFQQQYGYYEVRMKPSGAEGTDSCFWLLNQGQNDPEVDIAEFPSASDVNGNSNTANQWLHNGLNNNGSQNQYTQSTTLPATPVNNNGPYNKVFHTYGMDWEPAQSGEAAYMKFYVDGTEVGSGFNSNIPAQPLHLLLSVEMEVDPSNAPESWFGNPANDPGAYPAKLQVNYVRVWQKTALITEAAYNGPHDLPGTIQAADYDTGGQGFAYNQTIGGAQTGYRADNSSALYSNGQTDLGWTAAGQWYKYTSQVATAGTYSFTFSVSAASSGGTFHVLDSNGTNLTGEVTVPDTGSNSTFQTTAPTTPVSLAKGKHVLKVIEDSGSFNIASVTVTAG